MDNAIDKGRGNVTSEDGSRWQTSIMRVFEVSGETSCNLFESTAKHEKDELR